MAQKRELIRQRKIDGSNVQADIVGEEIKPLDEKVNDEEISKYEFMAFARVFSGTIVKGQTLFILSPRHNPADFVGKVNF